MKKIVVLSGAGISAESGIKTFRDADGLWEGYDVMEVASPEGWNANPKLVLDFYNQRRAQLKEVKPNGAHFGLVELEQNYEVVIITQNVDDLHERAGSKKVLHLHGELRKVRSIWDDSLILDWEGDLNLGDLAADGKQLRPHIVWFGEGVPMMDTAVAEIRTADIVVIIGTSLQVYPAAGLVAYAEWDIPVYYIDKRPASNFELAQTKKLTTIEALASEGVKQLVEMLTK